MFHKTSYLNIVTKNSPMHILPIDDLEEHYKAFNCHCKPKLKEENETIIVIHNAFDGRE